MILISIFQIFQQCKKTHNLSHDPTSIFSWLFTDAGYEDVRDFDGQWIRIEIKKGDLIVLPPGMYHRFTLDSAQYLKVGHLHTLYFLLLSLGILGISNSTDDLGSWIGSAIVSFGWQLHTKQFAISSFRMGFQIQK